MPTMTHDEIEAKVDALTPEIKDVWRKATPAITHKIAELAAGQDDGGALMMLVIVDHDIKKFLYDICLLSFGLGYALGDLKADGVTIEDLLHESV